MIGHFKFMHPDMKSGIVGKADYERDILTLDLPHGPVEFTLSHMLRVLDKPYNIEKPDEGWKTEFTPAEKAKLRPIAETLAILSGSAFFDDGPGDKEYYEYYLPDAHAVYEANGGDDGWAGRASFAKMSFDPESPTQNQIEAVATVLQSGLNDPVARQSGYIMTKLVMRALSESTPGLPR